MKEGKFSIFWAVILIVSLVWFLRELGYLHLDIPWLPLIIIIVSFGALINNFRKKD